ncbi:unnamed protein product, partial [Didymodactylos carnosus]
MNNRSKRQLPLHQKNYNTTDLDTALSPLEEPEFLPISDEFLQSIQIDDNDYDGSGQITTEGFTDHTPITTTVSKIPVTTTSIGQTEASAINTPSTGEGSPSSATNPLTVTMVSTSSGVTGSFTMSSSTIEQTGSSAIAILSTSEGSISSTSTATIISTSSGGTTGETEASTTYAVLTSEGATSSVSSAVTATTTSTSSGATVSFTMSSSATGQPESSTATTLSVSGGPTSPLSSPVVETMVTTSSAAATAQTEISITTTQPTGSDSMTSASEPITATTILTTSGATTTQTEVSTTNTLLTSEGDCDYGEEGCSPFKTGTQKYEQFCPQSCGISVISTNESCVADCPNVEFSLLDDKNTSPIGRNMRVKPYPLPFNYQFTDPETNYKVIWVTDRGYITLDSPFYAVEPTAAFLSNITVPYIAPFWTDFSSRSLSICEQWYWKEYTAVTFKQIDDLSDQCCLPTKAGISWTKWCNLYYQLRPASTCDGYNPPMQAWYGGDPHMETLTKSNFSCNMKGTFIYAETTAAANKSAISNNGNQTYANLLLPDELFAILVTTTAEKLNLKTELFTDQTFTYYSSFSMRLGAQSETVINVNVTDRNLFDISYSIKRDPVNNPFVETTLTNFAAYFYYPADISNTISSNISFSIARENEEISATNWNPLQNNGPVLSAEVPKLTISTYSGIAMQCYLITKNMACTLLLPKKYEGNVHGLVMNGYVGLTGSSYEDRNDICTNFSLSTESAGTPLNRQALLSWYLSSTTDKYRNYTKTSCLDQNTEIVNDFCVQDLLITQSALISSLTVRSFVNFQQANLYLERNPPSIQLLYGFNGDPHIYKFDMPHSYTSDSVRSHNVSVDVTVTDASLPINVQLLTSQDSPT